MQILDLLFAHYGWEGLVLMFLLFTLFCVQLYYYFFAYGRIPSYKIARRPDLLDAEPPLSVVIPVFSEDYDFVEERLPAILAQEYPDFEVVLVYVGSNGDFFEDLSRRRYIYPQLSVTKIHLDPRFPISRKMALNVGIKSARYEHLIFTSTDATPCSGRWLALMAKGFCKGEVVLGYCGVMPGRGLWNYLARTWRMMHSVNWMARAERQHPYRGSLHNMGFTKKLYFGANGFSHLNMNIGEDDLFLQQIMIDDNVSMVLSPRAALNETVWGGFRWWLDRERYYGSSGAFYPQEVKNFIQWEMGSRVLFFALVVSMMILLPIELKIVAVVLLLLRYVVVLLSVRGLCRRLGERGLIGRYFLYDLLSPLLSGLLQFTLLRKDERVWR